MPEPRLLLLGYLLLMDLVLFAFMGADKRRAKHRAWRRTGTDAFLARGPRRGPRRRAWHARFSA